MSVRDTLGQTKRRISALGTQHKIPAEILAPLIDSIENAKPEFGVEKYVDPSGRETDLVYPTIFLAGVPIAQDEAHSLIGSYDFEKKAKGALKGETREFDLWEAILNDRMDIETAPFYGLLTKGPSGDCNAPSFSYHVSVSFATGEPHIGETCLYNARTNLTGGQGEQASIKISSPFSEYRSIDVGLQFKGGAHVTVKARKDGFTEAWIRLGSKGPVELFGTEYKENTTYLKEEEAQKFAETLLGENYHAVNSTDAIGAMLGYVREGSKENVFDLKGMLSGKAAK